MYSVHCPFIQYITLQQYRLSTKSQIDHTIQCHCKEGGKYIYHYKHVAIWKSLNEKCSRDDVQCYSEPSRHGRITSQHGKIQQSMQHTFHETSFVFTGPVLRNVMIQSNLLNIEDHLRFELMLSWLGLWNRFWISHQWLQLQKWNLLVGLAWEKDSTFAVQVVDVLVDLIL